ncbi:MAG: hypothetical protein R2834_02930 [Rhodothermales bacterium]
MDSKTMAQMCRTLRAIKKWTQEQVADHLESRLERKVSKQSISYAENPEYPGLDKLRVQIIEELSGRQVEGPFWRLKDEPAEVEG